MGVDPTQFRVVKYYYSLLFKLKPSGFYRFKIGKIDIRYNTNKFKVALRQAQCPVYMEAKPLIERSRNGVEAEINFEH